MKASFLAAALPALIISCNLIDPPLPFGEARDSQDRPELNLPDKPGPGPDTLVLVSAAEFPSSYDWQRDSAFGAVNGTVYLFSNGKPVLAIPAGKGTKVDLSPDKHHIIGESLFTEYSDAFGTWISKDGEQICSWDTPEKLQGLLYRDGDLYTLGLELPGGAVIFRKNGAVVLKMSDAVLMGSFSSCSYPSTGALYEDEGSVCFSYKTIYNGRETLYMVKDSRVEKQYSENRFVPLDAKFVDSQPVIFGKQNGLPVIICERSVRYMINGRARDWLDGGLLNYQGKTIVAGTYQTYNDEERTGAGWESEQIDLGGPNAYFYCDSQNLRTPGQPPGGYKDCYFFHRHCACQTASSLAMVLTPKAPGRKPFLKHGSEVEEFDIHGYLSGVAIIIDK